MASPTGSSGPTNPRILRKMIVLLFSLTTAGILVTFMAKGSPLTANYLPAVRKMLSMPNDGSTIMTSFSPSCARDNERDNPLTALDAKYAHLKDDKFTIAIQTYKRPKELNETLEVLSNTPISSLLEIVVVWNDLESEPPANSVSQHGVPIRYRGSEQNSLNEKLLPDAAYKTKAILLSDDDVYYQPDDLEFVFQSWRKFAPYRLVGALPRCSEPLAGIKGPNDGQAWRYDFCSAKPGNTHYTMILANLCFAHIALLDYYSSDAPEAIAVRDYVDAHFNCEDIGLNFLASSLTGWGPLEANGFKPYHNMEPAEGISRRPGHLEARSQCLNDFVDIFGCMPLVEETSHIVRGMNVL